MWNVPSYRIRAYVKRQKASRSSKEKTKRPKLHLLRVQAQIRVIEGIALVNETIPANVVLNEISLRGMFLFSAERLHVGQHVAVAMDHPRSFYIRGKVVMCQNLFDQTGVLPENRLGFRIGVLFEFRSLEERLNLKKYHDELHREHLQTSNS